MAVGTLATAPLWYPPYAYGYPASAYPYAYPAYPGYPAYSYPAYSYPTTPPPTYVPSDAGAMAPTTSQSATVSSGAPVYSAPPPQGSAPGGGQTCQTVTVEGHNETRTLQSGQTSTAWVPTHTQQVCQ